MHKRYPWLLTACAMALGSCSGAEPAIDGNPDNPLEEAARERGVVSAETDAPMFGLYERDHELGRDALCLAPGKANADADAARFGVMASFGPGLSCRKTGSATVENRRVTLRFDKSDGCVIVAEFIGDSVQFPGSVPENCDSLCPSNATLAGLEIPRVGWAESDAAQMRWIDSKDQAVRPCA